MPLKFEYTNSWIWKSSFITIFNDSIYYEINCAVPFSESGTEITTHYVSSSHPSIKTAYEDETKALSSYFLSHLGSHINRPLGFESTSFFWICRSMLFVRGYFFRRTAVIQAMLNFVLTSLVTSLNFSKRYWREEMFSCISEKYFLRFDCRFLGSLRWLEGLKLIQLEQQKTKSPLIFSAKKIK